MADRGKRDQAGRPRISVLEASRLPEGVPGPAESERPADRQLGRFAPGNGIAARGGQAKARQLELAHRLGLQEHATREAFAPYRRRAASFRKAHCATLAKTVGGGVCGTGPSSIVAVAAFQLAMSHYFFDLYAVTGDAEHADRASKMGDAHRTNLLAAFELCAREAKSRADVGGVVASLRARAAGGDHG